MPFTICVTINQIKRCHDIPVLIPDWRQLWPPPPPDPWRQRIDELINPQLRKELVSLSQIDAIASQLKPDLRSKINSVITEYVDRTLQKSISKDVQLSIQPKQKLNAPSKL